MLPNLLPLLLLSLLPHTHSTSPPSSRGSSSDTQRLHPTNHPICADGLALKRLPLPTRTSDDCLSMWRSRLQSRHAPARETFYQPGATYPLYLHGAPGGCEYQIQEPVRRNRDGLVASPPDARLAALIDDQMAWALWQVLDHCVNQRLGGMLLFRKALGGEVVSFGVLVAGQVGGARTEGRVRRLGEQGEPSGPGARPEPHEEARAAGAAAPPAGDHAQLSSRGQIGGRDPAGSAAAGPASHALADVEQSPVSSPGRDKGQPAEKEAQMARQHMNAVAREWVTALSEAHGG